MKQYVKLYNQDGQPLGFQEVGGWDFKVAAYSLQYHRNGGGDFERASTSSTELYIISDMPDMECEGFAIYATTNYQPKNDSNVLIPQNVSTNIEGADAIDEVVVDNGALMIPFDIRSAGEYYWEATLQDGDWNDDDEFTPMYGSVQAKIRFTIR